MSTGYSPAMRLEDCTTTVINQLADILNDSSMHDWKALAGELGFTYRQITGFINNHHTPNPCVGMLLEWQKKDGSTLIALENSLKSIGRIDAVRIMSKIINVFSLTAAIQNDGDRLTMITGSTKNSSDTLKHMFTAVIEEVGLSIAELDIVGPTGCGVLHWDQQANNFKGQMLTFRQKNVKWCNKSTTTTDSLVRRALPRPVQMVPSTPSECSSLSTTPDARANRSDGEDTVFKNTPSSHDQQQDDLQFQFSTLDGSKNKYNAKSVATATESDDYDYDDVCVGHPAEPVTEWPVYVNCDENWYPNYVYDDVDVRQPNQHDIETEQDNEYEHIHATHPPAPSVTPEEELRRLETYIDPNTVGWYRDFPHKKAKVKEFMQSQLHVNGTYMLRPHLDKERWTIMLSIVYDGRLRNYLLYWNEYGEVYFIANYKSKNVNDLIEHYQNNDLVGMTGSHDGASKMKLTFPICKQHDS